MKGIGLKRSGKNRDKAKEDFFDKVEEIKDEDIREAVKTGKRVRIIQDSEDPKIEIPEYPEDSKY